MATDTAELWARARQLMEKRKPGEALCHLAELVSASPLDRDARLALAIALWDAGHQAGALKVMRALAERMVHDGYLLPAIAVIQHGLQRAGDEPSLVALLQRLHVRGARAKAGMLAVPPPLPPRKQAGGATSAEALLAMAPEERFARATEIGSQLPPAGPAATPMPLPLFGELATPAFIATVKRLHYRRVPAGTRIIEEGAPGDSLIILISGQVAVSKQGTTVGQLGSGAVLGEMALITRSPRSATVTAADQVEYFMLGRADVGELSKHEPKVLQELVAYCRSRLLLNLLRTSPLFSRFDEATRVRLLERFQTVTLPAGENAVTQGQPGTGLYVIATGRVQVQVASVDGGSVVVATLGPGDVFGEISLLKNQPATADVIATETVGAVVLPAADFQQVLAQYPDVRKYLETLSSERLKASQLAAGAEDVDPDDLVIL